MSSKPQNDQQRSLDEIMNNWLDFINNNLPEGVVFTIFIGREGDGLEGGYSNFGEVGDMPKLLREVADNIEINSIRNN